MITLKAMRALRLETGEEMATRPTVKWDSLQLACWEPFGRISREGTVQIPEQQQARVLVRQEEAIEDLVMWEESISFITLLGPQHRKPTLMEGFQLPGPPGKSILRDFDLEGIRRANERLGVNPDDMDYARERFPDLRTTGNVQKTNRTSSPPPPLNIDVHGLWEEEKHRQEGGRHRGLPWLRWNQPVRREALPKRHRDPEGRIEAWEGTEERAKRHQRTPPPGKKTRGKGLGEKKREEEQEFRTPGAGSSRSVWSRSRGRRMRSMW